MSKDAVSANPSDAGVYDLTIGGAGGDFDEAREPNVRPAVLARYRDLTKLRYDYPLVLADGGRGGEIVRSLSGVVDGLLQQSAPRGIEGERDRAHVLRLEQEIRALASRGTKGSLSQLWELAESNLFRRMDAAARSALKDSLARARDALMLDGEVVDCNEETPSELLTHLWSFVQDQKARQFFDKIDRLTQGLSDILKADFMKSADAHTPERLKRSVGTAYEAAFDFEAMSRVLRVAPRQDDSLPNKRRQRINSALSVFRSQKFFLRPGEHAEAVRREAPHCFVFDSCKRALDAFQDRLPEIAGLVKAMSIAELECENRYQESAHDPFFDGLDENSLTPNDLALFPSYLVCLRNADCDAAERAKLLEALCSGLPLKVLAQSDDILDHHPVWARRFSFGRQGSQLASMAVGLNSSYVLQSSSSHLYQIRERILRGMGYEGPALFSVFSGSHVPAADMPPYLRAAAAMESRAFPAFTYDPAAGADLASRFCIDDNPQAQRDWPMHHLYYEDEDHQRITEHLGFTFADFVACDRRYAGRFARVPRGKWHAGMIPVADFLELEAQTSAGKAPYVPMVDDSNVLQRLVVDDELILAARRCLEMWRSLQELGGINNSHASRLLEREKERWERERQQELEALRGQPKHEIPAPALEQETQAQKETVQAQPEEALEAPMDEPYIETPRCTTCDECIQINNRMFAYDDNKQAYIADVDAGTYRELVEAAESCQVAIIHPGKPKNPNEPDLADLIQRAEPFN